MLHSNNWTLPIYVSEKPLKDLDFPKAIKVVLARRGLNDVSSALEFLDPPSLPDPKDHFPDLLKAVKRLKEACIKNQKIAICGDYDADGMTSTALLMTTLNSLGAISISSIPNRLQDGYGLNKKMIKELNEQNIKLIVTVDNGVSAYEALEEANRLKIDVIITDHHLLDLEKLSSFALIHPDTTPINSPYRQLAGVGLAYVLAECISNQFNNYIASQIAADLFCIGTVADMAPLIGANRYLIKKNISKMYSTKNKGLQSLIRLSGITKGFITTEDIGFSISPKLNAVGRIGDPDIIVNLLTETNEGKAIELAKQCENTNKNRREICEGIEAEAIALLECDTEYIQPFLLLAQSHWHQGVIGIIASRLMERYKRPTAILTADGNGLFRASARSPDGFNIYDALEANAHLLEKFGGHASAAGFTIKPHNITFLQDLLNKSVEKSKDSIINSLSIKPESHITFENINAGFWKYLTKLEPFGIGNPRPLFWTRRCEVISKKILKGKYLKLLLKNNEVTITAIQWKPDLNFTIPKYIDIAFYLSMSYWNNKEEIQLELKAIKSFQEKVNIYKQKRKYICYTKAQELIIENEKGEMIKGNKIILSNGGIRKSASTNKYIQDLIYDAKISLGLIH